MQIDKIDRKVLNHIQVKFPICNEPYIELGRQLGIDGDNVINRIVCLKDSGIIRTIGPVMAPKCLGYQTTLVATKVEKHRISKVEKIINDHPGISHGYQRDHHFNVWFTFAVPPSLDIEVELGRVKREMDVQIIFSLPSIKTYKIGAYFNMDDDSESIDGPIQNHPSCNDARLSTEDKLIINIIQQDLPLVPAPFDMMMEQVNMNSEEFLSRIRSLIQRGFIRRYSASINHNRAGFLANAMVCWIAGPDIIDIAAHKITGLKEVSHCYERKTNPIWPYNLFTMIHGPSEEACQKVVEKIIHQTGLGEHVLLYSIKELKKKRMRYTV